VPRDTNVLRIFARAGRELSGPPELGQALMDLGATICTARRPRCAACPLDGCRSRDRVGPAPARRGGGPRFEDTDRYVRGRIVAALTRGEPLPEVEPVRLERALAGLARDGLVVREAGGVRLP
jgi:A/G-specific adenine glycosylase